jgi:predicted AAA+ superfamily ATPase
LKRRSPRPQTRSPTARLQALHPKHRARPTNPPRSTDQSTTAVRPIHHNRVVATRRPSGTIRRRHLLGEVKSALADTRVVFIAGARQAGKSTLAHLALLGRGDVVTRNLDDPPTLTAAHADPVGFVDHDATVFIDEVQRAPELLLPVKAAVDLSQRPGRFLLTGSANVLTIPRVSDVLTGRMEIIDLWPFSQGEIEGQIDGFVDRAFSGWSGSQATTLRKRDYVARAVRGGYPAVVLRTSESRRGAWFASYVRTLTQRDVRDIANIERPREMGRLLRLLAARSGQLFKLEEVARDAGLPPTTARRYLDLLEASYITCTLAGWTTSKTTRAIRAPKVFVRDTGLLCHLLGTSTDAMMAPSSDVGPVLETFVAMELARQLGWSATRADLYHFRTKDGAEVDVVLEAADGTLVGVEVKAGATVRIEDFRGLRLLAERAGARFRLGVVLYTGTEELSFGDRLRCLPMSTLWSPAGGL